MSEIVHEYHLRPIEECDLRLLLDWRNSPKVHDMMLTDHEITWDEHYAWFKRMETEPIKRNFIFRIKENPSDILVIRSMMKIIVPVLLVRIWEVSQIYRLMQQFVCFMSA